MRIVCPDCLTQYDVPDKLIGSGRRRLRCGQCGHGWPFEPESVLPAAVTDEALNRHFGQPSDDEAKVEVQAALRDEALGRPNQEALALPPEPVATTEADRFADIVRAARNNEIELEPEHPPRGRGQNSALRVVLLFLLILAVVFLERHALMRVLHLS